MPAILVVAHAPLAGSLLAIAGHLYPDAVRSRQLAGVDVVADTKPSRIQDDIRSALAGLDATEVLVLVDVVGASPYQAAREVVDGSHQRLVCGVNVPMLWRALCYSAKPLDELATRAADGGVQGIMQAGASRPQNQGPQPGTDDQDPDDHQQ